MLATFNIGRTDFVQPFEVMMERYDQVFKDEQEKLTQNVDELLHRTSIRDALQNCLFTVDSQKSIEQKYR